MASTIDILVAFDAQGIVEAYGGNNNSGAPVQIDSSKYIFMVTNQQSVMSGEGGSELRIHAQTEDTIRWREVTPGPDFESILYEFKATQGDGLISDPQPLLSTVTVPLPNPKVPTQPNTQTIKDYFWNSVVQDQGDVTYHFSFMIVDRGGDVRGYYWWDPFIHITT